MAARRHWLSSRSLVGSSGAWATSSGPFGCPGARWKLGSATCSSGPRATWAGWRAARAGARHRARDAPTTRGR
eukprot:11191993-Alexandrium_andersonii.AAC.1